MTTINAATAAYDAHREPAEPANGPLVARWIRRAGRGELSIRWTRLVRRVRR
ncbi:hypothetical protein ACIP5Y_14220 [Nocardia sp. NPDC088792]|uniref:hypothetical protein n=1 Tax=Nocardia sp. NPDC088792 TaxID=3364332 RepID=UPI0038208D93